MCDTGARRAEPLELGGFHVDRVCEPDVRSGPPDRFGEVDRAPAVVLDAVVLFFRRLAEMRVQVNLVMLAGKLGRRAHEVRRDGERRTRGQHHPRHRERSRIVMLGDHAFAVAQDRALVLDGLVGR